MDIDLTTPVRADDLEAPGDIENARVRAIRGVEVMQRVSVAHAHPDDVNAALGDAVANIAHLARAGR